MEILVYSDGFLGGREELLLPGKTRQIAVKLTMVGRDGPFTKNGWIHFRIPGNSPERSITHELSADGIIERK